MHVQRIELRNWLGYTGEHVLDLTPTLYAITAQHDGDARRSNWAGKTSLIEAMRFAFYGRTRSASADGWITEGERGGSVAVVLSNGTRIERTRSRGHATKLLVSDADGSVWAGEVAQAHLEAVLGYSADDFEVTCWFGQKQMARLIMVRPSERFELISGWFNLGKLQRAEEKAFARLATINQQKESVLREIADATAVVEAVRERWPENVMTTTAEVASSLQTASERAEAAAAAQGEIIRKAEASLLAFADAKAICDDRALLAQVQAEGKALAAELRALEGAHKAQAEARAVVEQRASATRLLGADYEKKRVVASGRFDGCCPVDERPCPVRDEINQRASENATLSREAHDLFQEATRQESAARMAQLDADKAVTRHAKLSAQLEALRQQARELIARTKGAEGWAFDEASFEAAKQTLQRAKTTQQAQHALADALRRDAELVLAQQRKADVTRKRQETIIEDENVMRTAARILGRQGAQKAISEDALAEIEAGANTMMRDAGIDLGVRISWAREGAGLAKVCAECGTAFAPKAKACKACNAERGHALIERLDIHISDTSGAAEDLAGAALQLAAAAWLRRERGAALCTAFLDEPFGALDEANRRAFASHLVALLRGSSGFEQAFIVAHHPDVLDGLPGRILVNRGVDGSTAKVV